MVATEVIWAHQVGGRDGNSLIDPAAKGVLASSFAAAIYEPASDALVEIRDKAALRTSKTVVLPYALSNHTGRATLWLTYCQFCSSLHEPLCDSYSADDTGYDYPLAETHKVVERRDVAVYRLDELPEITDGRVGAPDFLFLDTQGSEYEILEGAGDLLDGLTAVIAESSHQQFYEGERTFGELVAFLESRGLLFAASVRDGAAQPYRMPIGMRGNDWRVQTDGLFLRRIEDVEGDPVALRKLIFAAHFFSQNAYGFECMERYVARYGNDFGGTTYGIFLERLATAISLMPRLRAASFGDLYTVDESYARNDPTRRETAATTVRERSLELVRAQFDQSLVDVLLGAGDTALESVFRQYGLDLQAELMKRRRRDDTLRYLTAMGATVTASTV